MPKFFYLFAIICTVFSFSQAIAEPFIEDLPHDFSWEKEYRSPTERQIEYETEKTIYTRFSPRVRRHWPFFLQIIDQEEKGVFGYHAARSNFCTYQDIIKYIFEEILELEIKKEFHFFRIPLDPSLHEYQDSKSFFKSFPEVHDPSPEQRDQLLSLNYTLFGNFISRLQCTAWYFVHNFSWGHIDYKERLEFLFDELGIQHKHITPLFKHRYKTKGGILYQFFDMSHYHPISFRAYETVDKIAYPSLTNGVPDTSVKEELSDQFLGKQKRCFDTNYAQVRLIMNSALSLNPYSPIYIRQYEKCDPLKKGEYERILKEKIRNLPRDPEKVKIYKQKLQKLWHIDEE